MNPTKLAWRNLWKHKTTALISIGGLAVGLTCFLLLGTYLFHELRVDRFYPDAGRIALVTSAYRSPDDGETWYVDVTPNAVGPTLQSTFAEVETAARIYRYGTLPIRHGERLFNETEAIYADSTLFRVLAYRFVAGDPQTALRDPEGIVLTAAAAQKYFGDKNPIGQTLLINERPRVVTGVVETPPAYTQLPFSVVMPYHSLRRSQELVWHSANDITLLLLRDEAAFDPLQQQVNALLKERFAEVFEAGGSVELNIEKLTDVHLHSRAAGTGNIAYLYILGAIGIGLMLIACINFTNLVLARTAERAQEIGIRKVMGAGRGRLFGQFMLESALAVVIAVIIGLILAYTGLPVFNQYVGLHISTELWGNLRFIGGIAIVATLVTLAAGGWPALVLSAFRPITVLKGKFTDTRKGGRLRRVLVVFQFGVSILFMICTVIAGSQLHYLQTKDTGMNRSQVIVLDGATLPVESIETFKNQLSGRPGIQGVTASYDSPVNVEGGYTIIGADGHQPNFSLNISAMPIERDFVSVFGIRLLAGSDLTDADIMQVRQETEAPEYTFILNELAARALGWSPEAAIGKRINLNGRSGRIKAVADNFHFAPLREEVKPIVLFPEYSWFGKLFVRTAEGTSVKEVLAVVEDTWKTVNPNRPFDFHFLDQEYKDLYRREIQTTRVLHVFAVVTILVAAMGLFGLAAFTAQQRLREICIRKVLGASVTGLVRGFSANFVRLVVLATVIAVPVAWWLMNRWLQDFAYRVTMQWWMFAAVAVVAVIIAAVTVSSQAIKAALTNPARALRDE